MKPFLISLFLILSVAHAGQAKRIYSDELCQDERKIAGEFIEAELSGLRWQGTDETPKCLKNLKPNTMNAERIFEGDPALLDPEYLLPKGRKVNYSVKRLPDDLLEVSFSYIGKKMGKDFAVRDKMVLKLNFGRVRDLRGCASYFSEPEHFVMRTQCWNH